MQHKSATLNLHRDETACVYLVKNIPTGNLVRPGWLLTRGNHTELITHWYNARTWSLDFFMRFPYSELWYINTLSHRSLHCGELHREAQLAALLSGSKWTTLIETEPVNGCHTLLFLVLRASCLRACQVVENTFICTENYKKTSNDAWFEN